MKSHPIVWRQTLVIALGELVCCAIMAGVYGLIGRFTTAVVLGACMGWALATVNFLIMALCADIVADRAMNQADTKGQGLMQFSYMGRMLALFLILILCAKSGIFDLLALVLPLAFIRPILFVNELILKKKEADPK